MCTARASPKSSRSRLSLSADLYSSRSHSKVHARDQTLTLTCDASLIWHDVVNEIGTVFRAAGEAPET